MSSPVRPRVECERQHAGLVVPDVAAAVAFYTTKLGFSEGFLWGEPPSFAGVDLGEARMFLQPGPAVPNGCSVYFDVGDADALHAFQRASGVEILEPPGDREYGIRDYAVRDLYGYRLVFGHRLPESRPPLKIERVDVPVRLEKRLAALLQDLATHKRMSLSSCLEEILLHTCEPFGDGVASPHTKGDLARIQELKRTHGIDYDTHASYRFTEE